LESIPFGYDVLSQGCQCRLKEVYDIERCKPRQHFVCLSVHLSRSCWIDESPLISMIGPSPVEDPFFLYAASLLVNLCERNAWSPRPKRDKNQQERDHVYSGDARLPRYPLFS
jgi:hypothetical protein